MNNLTQCELVLICGYIRKASDVVGREDEEQILDELGIDGGEWQTVVAHLKSAITPTVSP